MLLAPLKQVFARRWHVCADSAYEGKLQEWVKQTSGWTLQIVKRPFEGVRCMWVPEGVEPPEIPRGFVVVKRGWGVERPFGWLGHSRRLSKDDEDLSESEQAWIDMALIRLLLTRFIRKHS